MSTAKAPTNIPDYGETNFITGMRAYAALAVVLIHSGGAGLRELGPFFDSLVNLGRAGVYVFFVISGYSVANSFDKASGYSSYIVRRLWRIVPLYYLWILLSLLMKIGGNGWAEKFGVSNGFYNLSMHFSFLSFLDYRVANSIIGVEWSIPIEVAWYVFLPLILRFLVRDKWSAIIFIPLSLVLQHFALKYGFFFAVPAKIAGLFSFPVTDPGLAVQWGPFRYFVPYILGVAAYRLRGKIPFSAFNYFLPWAALAAIPAYAAFPALFDRIFMEELVVMSLITFVLVLFGTPKDIVFRAVFANPAAIYLGSISYGLYLSHIPAKAFLLKVLPGTGGPLLSFLLIAGGATLVSSLTYAFFERPILRYSARRRPVPPVPSGVALKFGAELKS